LQLLSRLKKVVLNSENPPRFDAYNKPELDFIVLKPRVIFVKSTSQPQTMSFC